MNEIKAKIMKVFGKFKVEEYNKMMKTGEDRFDYCYTRIEELEREMLECFDEKE